LFILAARKLLFGGRVVLALDGGWRRLITHPERVCECDSCRDHGCRSGEVAGKSESQVTESEMRPVLARIKPCALAASVIAV